MTATATVTKTKTAPTETVKTDAVSQARAIKAEIDKTLYHLETLQGRQDKANSKLDSLEEQLLKEVDWKVRLSIKQQIHEHSEALQGLGIMRRDLQQREIALCGKLSGLLKEWLVNVAIPALNEPVTLLNLQIEALTKQRDVAALQWEHARAMKGEATALNNEWEDAAFTSAWRAEKAQTMWPDLERVIEQVTALAEK